jgi:hypothetical protein
MPILATPLVFLARTILVVFSGTLLSVASAQRERTNPSRTPLQGELLQEVSGLGETVWVARNRESAKWALTTKAIPRPEKKILIHDSIIKIMSRKDFRDMGNSPSIICVTWKSRVCNKIFTVNATVRLDEDNVRKVFAIPVCPG